MIFNDFLFEEINLVCMLILLKSHPIYNILSSENMDNWIKQGLNAKLISLSDDGSTITYIKQGKSRNFNNPEEKVQAEAFIRLVLEFGYPVENIKQFVSVTMGSEKKEADLIVYEDASHTKPAIIVEAKKQEVTQAEFDQAVNQCFSYANALAGTVKYIWVYSTLLSEIYRFNKEKNVKEQ